MIYFGTSLGRVGPIVRKVRRCFESYFKMSRSNLSVEEMLNCHFFHFPLHCSVYFMLLCPYLKIQLIAIKLAFPYCESGVPTNLIGKTNEYESMAVFLMILAKANNLRHRLLLKCNSNYAIRILYM